MKEKITKVNFTQPNFDIINNVTAAEDNPANIKRLLIEQIFFNREMERNYH